MNRSPSPAMKSCSSSTSTRPSTSRPAMWLSTGARSSSSPSALRTRDRAAVGADDDAALHLVLARRVAPPHARLGAESEVEVARAALHGCARAARRGCSSAAHASGWRRFSDPGIVGDDHPGRDLVALVGQVVVDPRRRDVRARVEEHLLDAERRAPRRRPTAPCSRRARGPRTPRSARARARRARRRRAPWRARCRRCPHPRSRRRSTASCRPPRGSSPRRRVADQAPESAVPCRNAVGAGAPVMRRRLMRGQRRPGTARRRRRSGHRLRRRGAAHVRVARHPQLPPLLHRRPGLPRRRLDADDGRGLAGAPAHRERRRGRRHLRLPVPARAALRAVGRRDRRSLRSPAGAARHAVARRGARGRACG